MPLIIQSSFAKGEIAPALYGRVDTAIYQVALRKARNCIIHLYGGVSNRAGLNFIGPVADHTYAPRLIRFQFKTADTYMLEFGDAYMRVLRDGGHVLEDAQTIVSITKADPAVVEITGHGYEDGDEVYIDGGDMVELTGRRFIVANKDTDTFELTDQVTAANIDSTSYTTYSTGGTGARVFTLTTPYAIADVPLIKFEQSADKMTLTHPSYDIYELTRTDHDAWTLTTPTFEPEIGYPADINGSAASASSETATYKVTAIAKNTLEEGLPGLDTDGAKSIEGISKADPAVVTVTSHPFQTGDEVLITSVVGMTEVNDRRFKVTNLTSDTFSLDDEDSTDYTTYSSAGTITPAHKRISDSAATRANTISWTAVPDAEKYVIYYDENGIFGKIGESATLSFLDSNIEADTSITPPRFRNPFFGTDNQPGAVGNYQQRRVFGGSNNNPDTSYYSKTGAFSNFTTSIPTQADDAITATLSSSEVNQIRHFVPGRDLIILTEGTEWRVNAGDNSGFAADTLKQEPQTFYGASHRRPIQIGNVILYVQETGNLVRTIGYSLQIDGYTGSNLSQLAHHLLERNTITDWAFSKAPENRVYMIRDDGYALTLAFDQEQEVIAWTTWDTDGKFESVGTLPHEDGEIDDQVYFVVKRTIGGNTVRYIERLASRNFVDVRDAVFSDSSLSYDDPKTITAITTGAASITVTAADHGFSNGDEVDFYDIQWTPQFDTYFNETNPDQLNKLRFVVSDKTTNTFKIKDSDGNYIDGTDYEAYVEGGTVRKAVSTLSGFRHLAGEDVVLLADGGVISNLSVDSEGDITLPRKFSRVHVGKRYIADVETLNVEAPNGTIQGKRVKIPKVTVRFERSRGLLIGPDKDHLVEIQQREFEPYGEPTNLLTGDKKIYLKSSWNSNGRLFARQKDPLPMTILAFIPEIIAGDDD